MLYRYLGTLNFLFSKKKLHLHSFMSSGRSSARLEYTSGGRVVASSNLVVPTFKKQDLLSCFFLFYPHDVTDR